MLPLTVLAHRGLALLEKRAGHEDGTAIRQLVTVEEQILTLTPLLNELSKSLLNLQLPDADRRELFGDSVKIDAWPDLLDQVSYFEHAKFALANGNFLQSEYKTFQGDVQFEGLAKAKAGHWLGLKGKQRITWQRHPEAPLWRISHWESDPMETVTRDRLMFSEALDRALPDLEDRRRARTSEHLQATIAYYARDMKDPPNPYFTPISANQKPGLSVVDINGDGFDDLYIMVRIGKNQLLRNRGDGTFEECAADYGLDFPGNSTCGLFADFDNDGDPDLMLGRSLKRSLYLENTGQRFVSHELGDDVLPNLAISMAAADFNADGLLDIYIATYRPAVLDGSSPTGGSVTTKRKWPDEFLMHTQAEDYYERHAKANPKDALFPNVLDQVGPPNVLLTNLGEGKFAPAKSGKPLEIWRNTLQATWADYDDDGDPDLYIANDWARDYLFRNDDNGTSFVDVTETAGTTGFGFAMGASWGDYDNDGQQDLYVSNMYSKAGRRITSRISGIDQKYLQSAEGNYLYHQRDGHAFQLVSGLEKPAITVAQAGWSWGGQFGDFDNDGFLDLYVLSGYFSAPEPFASQVDL
jgi:hypothetical protein